MVPLLLTEGFSMHWYPFVMFRNMTTGFMSYSVVFGKMTRLKHTCIITQVKEVCAANVQMILQALEQPNVEVSELIAQQKDRYQSKLL